MKIEYTPIRMSCHETITQGQVTRFSQQTQMTWLGSCISLILFSEKEKKAIISHITGNNKHGPFGMPDKVLDHYRSIDRRIQDPEYLMIGGTDKAPLAYDLTTRELNSRCIDYIEADVLGEYHRRIIVIPTESLLQIHKTPLWPTSRPYTGNSPRRYQGQRKPKQ